MEYLNLLTQDQRDELLEVYDMCFLSNKKEKKKFWQRVWEAAEMEPNEPVTQDAYELALYQAKEILLERGIKVFTRVKPRIKDLQSA